MPCMPSQCAIAVRTGGTPRASARIAAAAARINAPRLLIGRRGDSASRGRTIAASGGVGGKSTWRPRSASRCSRSLIMSRPPARTPSITEPLQRTREARLDGALGAAQDGGGLGHVEVQEEPAGDHPTVALVQGVDRTEERRALLRRLDRRFRRWGRIAVAELVDQAQLEISAAPGRPSAVARRIGDDPQQPGPQGRVAAKAWQRSVGGEEAILCWPPPPRSPIRSSDRRCGRRGPSIASPTLRTPPRRRGERVR